VDGVDRRLQLVRAGTAERQAAAHERPALLQERGIPARAVLLGERDEVAGRSRARGPSRVREQHEGEEAEDLGLARQEAVEHAPEADGLRAEVRADEPGPGRGRVALVEDEVDHGEHRAQARREVARVRHPVRDPGVADLALRARQALAHRRLGHAERARDVGRPEPAEQPQRERHLRRRAEGRVAAGEDQPQPLVADHAGVLRLVAGVQECGLGVLVPPGRLAAQDVDRPAAGGGDDPSRRARRDAVARPAADGLRPCLLEGVLGDVEIAEDADEDGDRAAVLGGEDPGDLVRPAHPASLNGRTSMGSPMTAA
jgi:hypothetical protein